MRGQSSAVTQRAAAEATPAVAAPGLILQSVREAIAGAYELLGALGAEDDVALAYLAREVSSSELAILRLDHADDAAPDSEQFQLVDVRALDATVPCGDEHCASCKAALTGWPRRCAACGTDCTGVTRDSGPGTSRGELMTAVRALAGDVYELYGDMARAEGGGPVYFARETASQRLVALRLVRDPSATDTMTGAFALGVTPLVRAAAPRTAVQPPSRPAAAKTCPQCGLEFGIDEKFCPNDGVALRLAGGSRSLVGQILGDRYHIVRKLGEGGMGEVYLGEHVKMGRPCAIKVMRHALVNDADAAGRFAREAANASRINHPSVAAVYDFGETSDGVVYLAMEYVDGEPLADVLAREGRLAPDRVSNIGRDVADALDAAHGLGIVHRDLKPDNVMLARGKGGRDIVKVVDFGIAKAMDGGRQSITRTGFVLGTPAYMSPEQITGDPLDGRSDLYSLGCILYELLTGEATFAGPSGGGIINRRLTEPPPRPRKVNEDVPRALDDVVWRALARSPADRYQTAAELSAALGEAMQGSGRDLLSRLPWLGKRTVSPPTRTPAPARAEPRPTMMPTVRAPRPSSGAVTATAVAAGYRVPQSPAVPTPRRAPATHSRSRDVGQSRSVAGEGAPIASGRARPRRRAWALGMGALAAAAAAIIVARERSVRGTGAVAPRSTTVTVAHTSPTAEPIALDTTSDALTDTSAGLARVLMLDHNMALSARQHAVTAGVAAIVMTRGDSLVHASELHEQAHDDLAAHNALAAARRLWDTAAHDAGVRAASVAAAGAASAASARDAPDAASAPAKGGSTSAVSSRHTLSAPPSVAAPATNTTSVTPPTPVPAPASAPVNDDAVQAGLVKDVIGRYVSALGAGQLERLQALYPAMSQQEQDGLRNLFLHTTDLSATPIGEPVANVTGSSATADFGYTLNYFVPAQGAQHRPFRWHAVLRRDANGWRIARLDPIK